MSKPKVRPPHFLTNEKAVNIAQKKTTKDRLEMARVVGKDGNVNYAFYTTPQLSKLIRKSRQYIAKMALEGKYPGAKMCHCGHSWLIPTIYAEGNSESLSYNEKENGDPLYNKALNLLGGKNEKNK